MSPTKEMIAAVEYMAETGKCDYQYCINCPGGTRNNDETKECNENGWADRGRTSDFSKTLQTSAINWLKENKPITD